MLAIVLSRRDFREYDQIVSLYTREWGKREAFARGVKKISSKNAASLMPFSLLEVEIVPGKEIDHLTKAQPVKIFANIISDLEKIMVVQYAGKLLDEFILPHERDERIFNLLAGFLDFINEAEKIASLNLAASFILKLWDCFGFGSQDKKYEAWLKSDWAAVSMLKEAEAEAYKHACEYAEFHSGHKLARLNSYVP